MRLINYRFSPTRRGGGWGGRRPSWPKSVARLFRNRANGGGRYDVVARKNAPRDNCMYVNDGVISLRLLCKRKKCMCVWEKEWENESERVQFSSAIRVHSPHHPRSKLLLFARYRFILMLSRCIRREKAIREKGWKKGRTSVYVARACRVRD